MTFFGRIFDVFAPFSKTTHPIKKLFVVKSPEDSCESLVYHLRELGNAVRARALDPGQIARPGIAVAPNPFLVSHMGVHEGVAEHQCPLCPFATRIPGNLRRHARLHSGAKPYQCPFCPFKCNDMDNLRRHVLATTKHPGQSLYECRFCQRAPPFRTNVARLFKAHLVASHAPHFGNSALAASYVSGLYEAQEDTTLTDEPLPAPWGLIEAGGLVPFQDDLL